MEEIHADGTSGINEQWDRVTVNVVYPEKNWFSTLALVFPDVSTPLFPPLHTLFSFSALFTLAVSCHVFHSRVFTACRNHRIASAVLAIAIPSACLSVCPFRPSHAGIVSKLLHVARCCLHCQVAKCV